MAGSLLTENGSAKAIPGALVGGRRSAPWKALLLTRGRRNRSWLLGTLDPSRIQPDRGATESVRGRSPAWHAVENAVAKQPRSRGALLVSSRDGRWSIRPKLEARRQSCVHLRLGHRKTWLGAVVNSDFGWSFARSARLTPCAQEPERSLGARFGCRLQRSARSIFPVAREASREAS